MTAFYFFRIATKVAREICQQGESIVTIVTSAFSHYCFGHCNWKDVSSYSRSNQKLVSKHQPLTSVLETEQLYMLLEGLVKKKMVAKISEGLK